MTYYDVLGLDPAASTEDIERAFRKLARQVHPDLNSGDPARAEARMKELNEIRDILSDPLLRAAYDERLRTSHPLPVAPAPAPPPPRSSGRLGRVALGLALGGAVAAALFSLRPRDLPRPSNFLGETAQPSPPSLPDAAVAPLLAVPTMKRARLDQPPPVRPRGTPRTRGMVHIGSSADEVLAAFGPPDRIETNAHPGEATLHYGSLRLEMKNGRVTGGDAAR